MDVVLQKITAGLKGSAASDLLYNNDKALLDALQELEETTVTETELDTAIAGVITSAADEEDITSITSGSTNKLRLKDRPYSVTGSSGKGVKIVRQNFVNGVNTLTAAMLGTSGTTYAENTTFIIRYDFTLTGWIRVGKGCRFLFEGGSIHSDNGSFILTQASADESMYSIDLTGANKRILTNVFRMSALIGTYVEGGKVTMESKVGWINVHDFGIYGNGVDDVTDKIINLLGRAGAIPPDSTIYFPRGVYKITAPISIVSHNVTIRGDSNGFDADSTIPIIASTHSVAYNPANTVYRGATILYFAPTAYTGTSTYGLTMLDAGSNNYRTNFKEIDCVSNRYRTYITEDYANGPTTGPKHRSAHYEAPALGSASDKKANCLILLYGTCENVNIYGFDGVGIFQCGETAQVVNSRISHCGIGIMGYNPRTNVYVTDLLLKNVYISRCYIGIQATYWLFAYGLWMDEIETYGIYDPTTNGFHCEITGGHFNHIDYAGIYSEGYLIDTQLFVTMNRCGAYYAGYTYGQVPADAKDKCCQIYAKQGIQYGQIHIKNTYARVGDIEATRGGYCIANNIYAGRLTRCQIHLVGYNTSNLPLVLGSVANSSESMITTFDKVTKYSHGVELKENAYGTTANRPVLLNEADHIGYKYLDTDLKKVVIWSGTAWLEYDGSPAGVKRHGKVSDRPTATDVENGFIFTYDDGTGFSVNIEETWMDVLIP